MEEGSKLFFNDRLAVGVAWAQAGRDYMQDAFSLSLSSTARGVPVDFMGIYDGHGPNGENIAREVAENLCDEVIRHYETDKSYTFSQAIEMGCVLLDDRIRSDPDLKILDENGEERVYGGSTSCSVWIKEGTIYNGNVGDSRFILSYNGRAIPISIDHKPQSPAEKARIRNAGGYVSEDERVNGILAVSRSFGDYIFKEDKSLQVFEQLVTAVPDVRTVEIDENIDFLVVSSDGVWDMMSNQEVVDAVIDGMVNGTHLNKICLDIINNCKMPINPMTGQGSDNMSMILAMFRQ